jgi:hypothetical protein
VRILKKFVVLFLAGALALPLFAGSYSSGSGRSYSSGSSRSSSSSAHSSSSSGHSSFSSSGHSSSSSGSRSSSPGFSSGSRSYSSGGGSSSSARPSGSSFSSGGSSSSSSGRSYSSGNRSYSSGRSSSPGSSLFGPSAPPSHSSDNGARPKSDNGARSTPPAGAGSVSRKPSDSEGYDEAAARAQAMANSRAAFTQAQQPRPAYTDPKGESRPIDAQDKTVQVLREQLDQERWLNRQARTRTFYDRYWAQPTVVYHDAYNSWFWYWLLDRSLDDRAYWAYNHRADMDQQRYRDLLTRDAQLEGRIRQLEAEARPVDPTYVPPGVDRDLVYTDDYVNAVYNPQPVPRYYASHGHSPAVVVLVIVVIVGFGVWFVFFKRW